MKIMKPILRNTAILATIVAMLLLTSNTALAKDPLPSWNDGASKQAIIQFVKDVTSAGGSMFVPPAERIAVFDNDGTLLSEQPMYFQLAFALDRVKALAPQHPEWKDKQPFKAALEGDLKTLAASGEKGLVELVMATHTGMTTEEFETIVKDWLSNARHPKFKRVYTELVFQPMLELLRYLRVSGFKTFMVSAGGLEYMRPWVEQVYGFPLEQVFGSTIQVKYEVRDGKPVLTRLPKINFIDDKAGKPVGIHYHIGRRPIAAFGNSDGDFEMLEYTTAGQGARLAVLIHHDDAEREFAYDRKSICGKLDRGLDEAPKRGWVVVSMKKDWKCVYPFEKNKGNRQLSEFHSIQVLAGAQINSTKLDPFERFHEARGFDEWQENRAWTYAPAFNQIGVFIQSFKGYPPRQASFDVNIEEITRALNSSGSR